MRQLLILQTLGLLLTFTCFAFAEDWEQLLCIIEVPEDEPCQSGLVIESGELSLLVGEIFILTAQFNSCYHREKSTVKGRYIRTTQEDRVDFELLGTDFMMDGKYLGGLPRTVGTITLESETLIGVFHDVLTVIRSSEKERQRVVARKIFCKRQK